MKLTKILNEVGLVTPKHKKPNAAKKNINEGLGDASFSVLIDIISYFIAGGLTYLVGVILKLIWNRFNDTKSLVKNLTNPSKFEKFTNELSKDSAFNAKFIKVLREHGGVDNAKIKPFVAEIAETKEFKNVLDKYYPKVGDDFSDGEASDRLKAITTFKLNMQVTLDRNGKWLVNNIQKKFPEVNNIK